MTKFIEFIATNYQWFLSGLGVFLLSIFMVKKHTSKINIKTKGNKSPGIVGGSYNVVEKDDK